MRAGIRPGRSEMKHMQWTIWISTRNMALQKAAGEMAWSGVTECHAVAILGMGLQALAPLPSGDNGTLWTTAVTLYKTEELEALHYDMMTKNYIND